MRHASKTWVCVAFGEMCECYGSVQVSVAELAEAEWQMLPRQARSISSDQVQMQRQQSLVSYLCLNLTACTVSLRNLYRLVKVFADFD